MNNRKKWNLCHKWQVASHIKLMNIIVHNLTIRKRFGRQSRKKNHIICKVHILTHKIESLQFNKLIFLLFKIYLFIFNPFVFKHSGKNSWTSWCEVHWIPSAYFLYSLQTTCCPRARKVTHTAVSFKSSSIGRKAPKTCS